MHLNLTGYMKDEEEFWDVGMCKILMKSRSRRTGCGVVISFPDIIVKGILIIAQAKT